MIFGSKQNPEIFQPINPYYEPSQYLHMEATNRKQTRKRHATTDTCEFYFSPKPTIIHTWEYVPNKNK